MLPFGQVNKQIHCVIRDSDVFWPGRNREAARLDCDLQCCHLILDSKKMHTERQADRQTGMHGMSIRCGEEVAVVVMVMVIVGGVDGYGVDGSSDEGGGRRGAHDDGRNCNSSMRLRATMASPTQTPNIQQVVNKWCESESLLHICTPAQQWHGLQVHLSSS